MNCHENSNGSFIVDDNGFNFASATSNRTDYQDGSSAILVSASRRIGRDSKLEITRKGIDNEKRVEARSTLELLLSGG